MMKNKRFILQNETIYDVNSEIEHIEVNVENKEYFMLGYPILYGIIYNFLFMDIKSIKWMIYDIKLVNNTIVPNIIYLCSILKIENICNKPWSILDLNTKKELNLLWENFYKSETDNKMALKSLILFYLRWSRDNDNLDLIDISSECLKKIKINLDNVIEELNIKDDDYIFDDQNESDLANSKELDICFNKIYPKIKFEQIYNYIYESMQKFRYTWYGYVCLNENKIIMDEVNYIIRYSNIIDKSKKIQNNYISLTPKNIYNFFKALIHIQQGQKYVTLSQTCSWNNLTFESKEIFIQRLKNINIKWFNISKNIKRTYEKINKIEITKIMENYIKILSTTNIFPDIIIQTLVYNGMFTYFKYNPTLTSTQIVPNKNTNYSSWEKYILSNITIKEYLDSYHSFSNTTLRSHGQTTESTITNSKWYTNFGANWIAQIQLFHHYLNNRVLFITGATGAGKSTVAPFLLVYAVKIIDYNNNARVVCTQPRTQPVKDNSEQISKNIGLPIKIKTSNQIDPNNLVDEAIQVGEAIPSTINYIQYKHKNGSLVDELYHPCLRLYTDGSLYNVIKQSYIFKKTIPTYLNTNSPQFLSTNLFDVILVDEAHEHNINMDMILTLSKYSIYINNQVTLGIISATMDDDEIIYRKFYEPIDDNWAAPLDIRYTYQTENYNKNFIDRRIHLSIPFGGMNFQVNEYMLKDVGTFKDLKKINQEVKNVINHILSSTNSGDILIFQPGESDIKKLVTEINILTPSDIIAIPFYSKLDKEILENIVKKIDKKDVRKSIRYPKNKYDITQFFNIPEKDLLPESTYKRFIVIATNIAEASITIDTLEYVIDIGNQKISVYDPNTNQDYLEIREIAIPNQKQRKGRVGRTKPGNVYYTYDKTKLSEKVVYKMNIENINSIVLDLVTTSPILFIDEFVDPYKTTTFDTIPLCIRNQYIWIDLKGITRLYTGPFARVNTLNIVYPYSDGKYTIETLKDPQGIFYIIHPNEDYFIRDPTNLKILSNNKKPKFYNKITRAFELGKSQGIIGDDNLLTKYGELVNSLGDFLELTDNSIDFGKMILDSYSLNINTNLNIFSNILMFIVFRTTILNLRIPNYMVGKADYLIELSLINSQLFNKLNFSDIYYQFNPTLENFDIVILNNVNKILNLFGKQITNNYNEIKKILISFYTIKIKIQIVEFNSKYILTSEFEKIINTIILITKSEDFTNNELIIPLNKIIKYFNFSNKYMKKSIITKLSHELNNVSYSYSSSKNYFNLIKKNINQFLSNSAIFKNEYLTKINLDYCFKYSSEDIERFNSMSDYDKLSFLIIKNFPQNILTKVSFTEFYINYYNRDINRIYGLEKIMSKYTKTKVPSEIRNDLIFGVGMNDNYDLSNIMVLSENVVNLLDKFLLKQNTNLFKKQNVLDKELANLDYQEDKFTKIMNSIDKIYKFINK